MNLSAVHADGNHPKAANKETVSAVRQPPTAGRSLRLV